MSFIISSYEEKHPYYEKFKDSVNKNNVSYVEAKKELLTYIKTQIENGRVNSIKDLISAENFTSFLEMAEHLRNLCYKNGIQITKNKNAKDIPKKVDLLNAELAKAVVNNKLDQKM